MSGHDLGLVEKNREKRNPTDSVKPNL